MFMRGSVSVFTYRYCLLRAPQSIYYAESRAQKPRVVHGIWTAREMIDAADAGDLLPSLIMHQRTRAGHFAVYRACRQAFGQALTRDRCCQSGFTDIGAD